MFIRPNRWNWKLHLWKRDICFLGRWLVFQVLSFNFVNALLGKSCNLYFINLSVFVWRPFGVILQRWRSIKLRICKHVYYAQVVCCSAGFCDKFFRQCNDQIPTKKRVLENLLKRCGNFFAVINPSFLSMNTSFYFGAYGFYVTGIIIVPGRTWTSVKTKQDCLQALAHKMLCLSV